MVMTRNMKILDIYDEKMLKLEWESAIDGLTYSLNEIGKEHEVEVACIAMDDELPHLLHKDGFTIKFMEDAFSLIDEIGCFKPDRLLLNGISDPINLHIVSSSKYNRLWKAIYYHGGPLVDSCFHHCKKIILQTNQQKLNLLRSGYGFISPKRIEVVPFGSDPKYFYPIRSTEKEFLVTYQGTFSQVKRNDLAAEMFGDVDGKLFLFGRPYSREMVERCRSIQLIYPGKIEIRPERIPNNEVPFEIQKGYIGFLPGIEGGTRGLSEYLMCGLPVITFEDSNSVAEVISGSGAGIICRKDKGETNSSIKTIMSCYRYFSKNALNLALSELSADIMYDRLVEALELT